MQDLKEKVALVTGGSRGIGRAVALQLAARGALVAVHYGQNAQAAESVVAEITAAGGQAFAIGADLAAHSGVAALYQALDAALQQRTGSTQFDILVNNAGVGSGSTIGDVDEATFDRVIQVNLKAPFFIIQQALPRLRDGGRIINVSSMGTRAAYPRMAVYAPAKAGLEALTLLLAQELGPRGITVNAVMPGATATDMNANARNPTTAAEVAKTIALGRVGQPEDVAGAICLLAGAAAGWITGQTIDASGGQRL